MQSAQLLNNSADKAQQEVAQALEQGVRSGSEGGARLATAAQCKKGSSLN